MTIFFANKEPIDINAIAIMGVSVKTGSSPIGYFGTGLKFAIATLLRTGHEITLWRSGEKIEFKAVHQEIRGEEFQRVVMHVFGLNNDFAEEKLGFTTALGRNWEPWQAYRELRSNCIDEGGVVNWLGAMPHGDDLRKEFGTIFEISGDGIEQAHLNRREIFLESIPLFASNQMEIHAGATNKGFYRGVRAHEHPAPALFTYNITTKCELTEDRTIKGSHYMDHWAMDAIVECDNEGVIEKAVMATEGTFEHRLSYAAYAGTPSVAFMNVMKENRLSVHCNQSAVQIWRKHAFVKEELAEVELDDFDNETLDLAFVLLKRLGVTMIRSDFLVVEGLGPMVYGTVRDNRICLAKIAFDLGARFVASTLYEEHLHKNEDLRDCTRELQNVLFEKLLSLTERIVAMEKKQ